MGEPEEVQSNRRTVAYFCDCIESPAAMRALEVKQVTHFPDADPQCSRRVMLESANEHTTSVDVTSAMTDVTAWQLRQPFTLPHHRVSSLYNTKAIVVQNTDQNTYMRACIHTLLFMDTKTPDSVQTLSQR